ncbi:MAG: hypothetical protein M1836_005375 [Candelina mexicana]|nr:MAG: hypothetical protein M1836_005375 [Candelina mexicana]
MSKRKTDVQGCREGSFEGDGSNSSGAMDRPGRATAAQLANRKIKGAKGIRRTPSGPASASFPSPSQQPNNYTAQGAFGNLGSSTFDTASAAEGASSSQQQQQGAFGFGQQGGNPFDISQSFPPNNPSTSSTNQQGPQSTTFSGFGGGGGGSIFGGPSSEFSFTAQNQNNPFTSSNGAAPNNPGSGTSTGFKGSIFNLPGAGDPPANTSSQPQAQASNPFLFAQSTQAPQDKSAGPRFGQQNIQSQISRPDNNPFASPGTHTQQPLNNIFGQQSKEFPQAQQGTSIFSQPVDSMQTSPDTSPHKVQEPSNGSFPPPSVKPVATTPTKASNPFDSISYSPATSSTVHTPHSSTGSSDSLFSRYSQPSSAPTLFSAQGPAPSINTLSAHSQPLAVSSTSTSSPSTVDTDSGVRAPESGKALTVTESAQSAPAQNPFARLKVPAAINSGKTGPLKTSKTNGTVAKSTTAPTRPSFGFQSPSTSVASIAVSSPGGHKELFDVPISIPNQFTDAQKRFYTISHRLRSLNASFTDTVVATSNTIDITPLLQFYLESHEAILGAGGVPKKDIQSNKRKADDETPNNPSNEPDKKLKLGTSVLGRPLAASSLGSTPNKDVLGPPGNSSSQSSMVHSQPAGGNLSITPRPITGTGLLSQQIDEDQNLEPRFALTTSQVSYPSLPDASKSKGGSQTANIFKNILDKADQEKFVNSSEPTINGIKAATPFSFQASSPKTAKPSSSSASSYSLMPSSTPPGPADPADADKPAFQLPKFGSNTPNFLAQFTSTAKEAEKEAKAKRKAEDFDSDDDNEEDWEKKDAEQQRAKKQKISEMTKDKVARLVPGKGFTFDSDQRSDDVPGTSNIAPTPAAGSGSGTTSSADPGIVDFRSRASSPTPSTFGGASIFDTSKPLGQDRALSITNNIFGHLSDADSGADGSKTGDADDEDTASEGESETDDNPPGGNTPASLEADSVPSSSKVTEPVVQGADIADQSGIRSEKPGKAQDKPETSVPQPNVPGRSLFDRISKDQDGNAIRAPSQDNDNTPPNPFSNAAASSSDNIFGQSLPSNGDTLFGKKPPSTNAFNIFGFNTSPAGDHTFKHDSPIKFGSTAAPSISFTSATPAKESTKEDVNGTTAPFANLFGAPKAGHDGEKATSSQRSSTFFGSPLGKSTDVGFGFGGPPKFAGSSLLDPSLGASAATSRASSPGATTDTGAESANESTAEVGEEEDHSQLDLTNGGPGEEDEDVLYEVRAKALVLEKQKYESKGVGFLRVLKHRETGKVRILLRQDPSGKLIINAALLSGVDYTTKTSTSVSVPIPTENGTLRPWIVRVGKAEDADELAKVLDSNKSG